VLKKKTEQRVHAVNGRKKSVRKKKRGNKSPLRNSMENYRAERLTRGSEGTKNAYCHFTLSARRRGEREKDIISKGRQRKVNK